MPQCKERRKEYNRTHKWMRKKPLPPWEFVGVDGEGSTTPEGKSVYQMLGAYGPKIGERSIENKEGLSTIDCLEFFLSLRYRRHRLCVCGYSFGYDVSNILKDFPVRSLERIRADKTAGLYVNPKLRYKVRVIHRKCMDIYKMQKIDRKWKCIKFVKVYDVFGFFQTSFLKAIEEWKVADTEQKSIVAAYKKRRGENLENDWNGWQKYNLTECRLLSKMMADFAGVCEGAGIKLTNWWGAGAIASAMMKERNIKAHIQRTWDDETDSWIKRAFFGGQIQRLQVGIFNGPTYHYDINSAYPWATSQLPSLAGGTWRETDHFEPEHCWALYEIEWDFSPIWGSKKHGYYGPLPWRTHRGSILYMKAGWGVYWYWEVAAVLKHWSPYVKVISGKVFQPATEEKPFFWVVEAFKKRNELKQAGDPRNVPLKLGLNSLYGKTSQRQGSKDAQGRPKEPPYQSYFWAGNITSMTRGKLLNAIGANTSSIISMATDGIFTTSSLSLALGDGLGEWSEEPTKDRFELFANGVYRGCFYDARRGKTRLLKKVRGVEDREFRFAPFKRRFKTTPDDAIRTMSYHYQLKRFYGYRTALHRNKPELMNCWGIEKRQFLIVGLDCFHTHPTDIPHCYRVECYVSMVREKKPNPTRFEKEYFPRPGVDEERLLASEQPK